MNIIDREGYGPILTCSSTDAIGAPVRFVSPGVVTTADSSALERTLVVGFIVSKPTATTCLISDKYYYSGASGFSGFSGTQGQTGFANSVYLTNSSGFSSSPGSITKVVGQAISPREAILQTDVSDVSRTRDIYKNRIINGDMKISQRNPTASGASAISATFMTDRFRTELVYDGTPTWTLDTDVPTNAQAGRQFQRSLKFISTQDSVIAAGQYIWLWQRIEGHNIADIIGNGYNNGFTLSFWVKSSTTGTYCVCFSNSGRDRNYPVEYVINTANTWEFKVITVTSAPPSGGTWDTSNGTGLSVHWVLASGSTYNGGTNATWNSNSAPVTATANQVNFASGVTNNFWITGIQLEAGVAATPFEMRPYGIELMMCQRYCYVLSGANGFYIPTSGYRYGTSSFETWIQAPVQMRAQPSSSTDNVTGITLATPTGTTVALVLASTGNFMSAGTYSDFVLASYSSEALYIVLSGSGFGGTAGDAAYLALGPDVRLVWGAEL